MFKYILFVILQTLILLREAKRKTRRKKERKERDTKVRKTIIKISWFKFIVVYSPFHFIK